ncbi:hypothetical protein [Persicitalea jodogahamensis]|uniref:hypothetical protein n=1 Tax=Persicitalea jodogahamensis TaxID=402147 RepID=UPI001676933D|nr:hypothetical protein [Persicitalea jodogahamensis]
MFPYSIARNGGGFVTIDRQIEKDAGVTLFMNVPEKEHVGLLGQRFDPVGKPL